MITEIYEFWFFCPKMAVLWRTSAFQKKVPETPIFIVFWGWALFGPRCQKREILKSHPKKKKWLITGKLFFGIFAVFFGGFFFSFFFFFFFCFLSFFCVFFGGCKGQVRWPEGPPHLALNPPYLFFCFFFFVLFFCCFFGGFKGQVRWPEGPPHLALNPPYLLLLFFCFVFCFLFFFGLQKTTKNLVFPPEKGIFCLFSVFLFLSPLAFLGLPLLLFLFLCLSLFFFSFFLPSCLSFLLSFGSLFLSLSFFFFLLCLCFMKGTT